MKTCYYILPVALLLGSCTQTRIKIEEEFDIFIRSDSPVSIDANIGAGLRETASANKLALMNKHGEMIPVQTDANNRKLTAILPEDVTGRYKLVEIPAKSPDSVGVFFDKASGQFLFFEGDRQILKYNYNTVYEDDVVRPDNDTAEIRFDKVTGVYLEEYLKENPEADRKAVHTTSIYAVPRSDYIHPLYGLEGEMLTRDWPDGGHPHHRGIFWAWPEVEWGSQRGDIYALQRIFARPVGRVETLNGPVFAQLLADNLWMWEDSIPIVRETAVIRVYHSAAESRTIDITIRLEALKDSITIATRGTNSYGAFNARMQTPEMQKISYYTDDQGSQPRRSWADFSGIFRGGSETSGMLILQHRENPEYPGPWQEYPNLSWIQPVFPSHNTRYPVKLNGPLILRYRLIIHKGSTPSAPVSETRWDAYNSIIAPRFSFGN